MTFTSKTALSKLFMITKNHSPCNCDDAASHWRRLRASAKSPADPRDRRALGTHRRRGRALQYIALNDGFSWERSCCAGFCAERRRGRRDAREKEKILLPEMSTWGKTPLTVRQPVISQSGVYISLKMSRFPLSPGGPNVGPATNVIFEALI